MINRGAAPDKEQSLIAMIALLYTSDLRKLLMLISCLAAHSKCLTVMETAYEISVCSSRFLSTFANI